MKIGSLCTGYGGLDMAVQAVLGGELAWVCDIDPGSSALLAHRHPDILNHHDLIAMDWAQAEAVDVITAGWPCQPWSQAGKRKGAEDERAIWPAVAAAIRTVRPRLVLLENVPAVAAVGELERATNSLAQAGYVGSWGCLRASDVGAPHRRERMFIVAADATNLGHEWGGGARLGRLGLADSGDAAAHAHGRGFAGDTERHLGAVESEQQTPLRNNAQRRLPRHNAAPANTQGGGVTDEQGSGDTRRLEVGPEPGAGDRDSGRGTPTGTPELGGSPGVMEWAGYRPAIDRWERILGRPAPAPTVLGKRGGRQLAAPFVEWLMGLPEGWVCDVPGLTRNQQLKLLGNGVIPQQAEAALRLLLPRLVSTEAVAA